MEERDYLLFETYLEGDMPKDDIVTFKKRLEKDSGFNDAFKLYKETASFLEDKFKNEDERVVFKANLQNISQAYFSNAKSNANKIKQQRYLKFGVAACTIMLLGFFIFNQFSSPDYNDYANYDTLSLTVRGENQALLQTAETAFNNKNFDVAKDAFEGLLVLDKNNAELTFYYALCNIETNNFEPADNLLNSLQKGTSVYKQKAVWFLALSKLKQGEPDECAKILKTIPQDAEDYAQAQKLLNKLD
ncbi:MAG: hypothetical protein ACK5NB_06915 [Flavobacteriaceae bacterium]